MNILILNWRDIKNPLSGGAEIFTHELLKRLVKKGFKVTLFCSFFKRAKEREKIDGINIIRQGHPDARYLFNSVHFKAFKYYSKNLKGKVDLVIDEIHGVPFFTPLYVKEKKVALVCEIAGNLWDLYVTFPFSIFGKILEKIYFNLYMENTVLTISPSSKNDLIALGVKSSNIKILPMGSNSNLIKFIPKKEKRKTLIFVSRISKSKGIEDAIKAMYLLKKQIPSIRLWIVGRGSGDYINRLQEIVDNHKMRRNIFFRGYISDKQKENLLTRADILIAPSIKEGWGLTIDEAGARATPSVVYNSSGLKDSVKNGVNGIICEKNNPKELAKNVLMLLNNQKLYTVLQKGAMNERKKHTWEKTVSEFLSILK